MGSQRTGTRASAVSDVDVSTSTGHGGSGQSRRGVWLMVRLLRGDWVAFGAACLLTVIVAGAVIGRAFAGSAATSVDLRLRNMPPFSSSHGLWFVLGADPLGRSELARLIVGAGTTLFISVIAMTVALFIGGSVGIVVGYARGAAETVAMRIADIMLSFPTLLLAVVLIYVFRPSLVILVSVLAVTRVPAYMRVARAETLDVGGRDFVLGARALGARRLRILTRHIAPVVAPTLLTYGAIDLAYVILLESSLSFLGQGVQAPGVSWGLLVAEGREYLRSAWWLTVFPGILITTTTICLNVVSGWVRLVLDPRQRWRLENGRRSHRLPRSPAAQTILLLEQPVDMGDERDQ